MIRAFALWGSIGWLALVSALSSGLFLTHASAGELPAYGPTADPFLPFPSDLYTKRDPSTPTGRRLAFSNDQFPAELRAKAPFDAEDILRRVQNMDGFSPEAPLVIAFNGAIAASYFPEPNTGSQKSDWVTLQTLDTGEAIPVRVQALRATSDAIKRTFLIIHPLRRLEHERRYVVVVKYGLSLDGGKVIQPRSDWQQAFSGLRSSGDEAPWKAEVRALGSALARRGWNLDEVLHAFHFTVQSASNYMTPLKELQTKIEQKSLTSPYHATTLSARLTPFKDETEAGVRVAGRFDILQFSDADGRKLDPAQTTSLPFWLRMPEHCPEGGCPVAIFGHGLGASKMTMFQVMDYLAARGMATIAVATLYHNTSLGPSLLLPKARKNMSILHAVFQEHITRNMQVVELIRQDLSARDIGTILQDNSGLTSNLRLRADRIFYLGQSMGGICGVATSALSPAIRAVQLDVAGGSLGDLFFDSKVATMLGLGLYRVPGLTTDETIRVIPLVSHLFDDLDPVGFAPFVRAMGPDARTPRMVNQHLGLGDGLIPNWTGEKLRSSLGIPLLRAPEAAASNVAWLAGEGARYYRFTGNWFFAHLILMRERPATDSAEFLSWANRTLDAADNDASSVNPGQPSILSPTGEP